MGMSAFYSRAGDTAGEAECIATIQRAAEIGVTMIDTASMYGPFTNEVCTTDSDYVVKGPFAVRSWHMARLCLPSFLTVGSKLARCNCEN